MAEISTFGWFWTQATSYTRNSKDYHLERKLHLGEKGQLQLLHSRKTGKDIHSIKVVVYLTC